MVLVAGGLGVTPDVFREAFSRVKPAPAGQEPDPRQVQLNKRALLDALSKYGVTNDRLDEVSDTYRYRPGAGNVWKHTDAMVEVVITNVGGKVTGFGIKNAGNGYSSPPQISVPGFPNLKTKVTLQFTKDLATNGSIKAIEIIPPATLP